MKTSWPLKQSAIPFSFYFIFLTSLLTAQPTTFDGDKPLASYDAQYTQEFNPTVGWDRFEFYGQWNALMPSIFNASDISTGALQFKWIEKRVICSKKKYSQPYLFETDIDYSTGSNRGGIIIRIASLNETIQEPDSDPGFNSEGIAFYPTSDGSSMIVQFSGVYMGYGGGTDFTRILVPKPEGVNTLFERGILRIEDFGSSVYVYYNDAPYIRIELQLQIAFDEWNLRAWQPPGSPRNSVENYEDPEILDLVDKRIKGNDLASQYTMAGSLFAASFCASREVELTF